MTPEQYEQAAERLLDESYKAAKAEYRLSGPEWRLTARYPDGGGKAYFFCDLARAEECAKLLQGAGMTTELASPALHPRSDRDGGTEESRPDRYLPSNTFLSLPPEQHPLEAIKRYAESIVGPSASGSVGIIVVVEDGRATTVFGKINPPASLYEGDDGDDVDQVVIKPGEPGYRPPV